MLLVMKRLCGFLVIFSFVFLLSGCGIGSNKNDKDLTQIQLYIPAYNAPNNTFPLMVNGESVILNTDPLQVGDMLDDVVLDMPAPTFDTVESVQLSNFSGYILIYTLPSLDTPVCTKQTKQLEAAAELFPQVNFVVISADTPFALNRFCIDKDITTVSTLSDARTRDFAQNHGFYLPSYGLLTRAVIVVNENLEVLYVDYVQEVTAEVDLLNAFAYLDSLGLMKHE